MDKGDCEKIKLVVAEALAEQDLLQSVIKQTVAHTLEHMGMDATNPLEMQKDFQTLREWRELVGSLRKKGWLVFVGFLVTMILAMAWAGLKASTFKIF